MKKYYAIGLMSGTSLDGLDICYAEFIKNPKWNFKILSSKKVDYDEKWHSALKNSISLKSDDLLALNVDYGLYLGEQVEKFRQENSIEKVDVIASHGHTVFHQPHHKFTLQIGDGRAIKLKNDFPIVYDFRSQDVIMGGNGAPLVPIGDSLLFNEYNACLNLGGFSNISFEENHKRIAFDICPINIVLNHYSQKLGFDFDNGGNIAKTGNINANILNQLNKLNFYQKTPPKSLGLEWVIQNIYPLLNSLSPADALATFTQHSVEQIRFIFKKYNLINCLITGGGVYNSYLIQQLKKTTTTEIIIAKPSIIEYKEALIFSFMGVLKLINENNILSSATGSYKDHCSGLLV